MFFDIGAIISNAFMLFPMTVAALGSICWPDVVMWNWFQRALMLFPMTVAALGSICWPDVVMWNWFQWW